MLEIRRAESREDIAKVQTLWTEYWESLDLPLTFQRFGQQLQSLPGEFAPPAGLPMLAISESEAAGTIAVRPLNQEECEAKRLYVSPRFRGAGLGRKLLAAAIENARRMGYHTMYGDTLTTMHQAAQLYESIGFVKVDAYSPNPTPGAIYLKLVL